MEVSSKNTNNTANSPPAKKTMGEKLKPLAIFGMGLYLGLAFFRDLDGNSDGSGPGQKREGSAYLKDLKENFERSGGNSR